MPGSLYRSTVPLVKTKHIIAASGVVLLAGVLVSGVASRTLVGRAVRGISTFAITNASDTPLRNVQIYLTDSRQTAITKHFDVIQPHLQVRVAVHTSDLYVHRVDCEQGEQRINYDEVALATTGEILVLVVGSSGKISRVYAD